MKEASIDRTTKVVHLEYLRTEILLVLVSAYPKSLNIGELQSVLERSHSLESCLDELHFETTYLAEKQLIRSKEAKSVQRIRVQITARGIDFVNGHVQEVG